MSSMEHYRGKVDQLDAEINYVNAKDNPSRQEILGAQKALAQKQDLYENIPGLQEYVHEVRATERAQEQAQQARIEGSLSNMSAAAHVDSSLPVAPETAGKVGVTELSGVIGGVSR